VKFTAPAREQKLDWWVAANTDHPGRLPDSAVMAARSDVRHDLCAGAARRERELHAGS
jgi:hypothetical protein